ncbi:MULTISPECIES: sigma-54-dependent Fis family transcriptional regulator [unclassified Achromobacter]|uniref:sigma-54-dependent Fis family transcriptional regulator n=1 Tax=unclassified Achromobacter TaxID=2626865 RepID=UPI000B5155F3|nr:MULTISPECIES: sigma-54-dependent Fis family transcriptional regulator [unclassified Achromobacter]OWT75766.1 sigma-54-dependent Fis family transcriptional regulator [Achromobacter sp. HZ28]OWT76426.1 sigma-54-dependent Fis family transcriptional regulator [Achromobacter sp. HZ34]
MSIPSHQAALSAARRLFRQKGVVPEHLLADPILRSWRRCAESGQDMRGARLPALLTQTELRQELDRHAALRRLCAPVMADMKQRARAAGGLVVLTDAAGLVLDSGGSADFLDRASQLALAPGASWSEAAAGTNAIGTALVERRAIAVQGAEHYFEPNRVLTCAAMPILDPAGRTLGLLDLTCHADGRWRDAGDSLRAAIDQVESALFEDLAASCLMLRLHTRADGLERDTAARLAFDGDTLVAANRHALALLGIDRAGLGVFRYDDLFAGSPGQAAAAGRLHRQDGQMLHARVRWPDQGGFHSAPALAAERHDLSLRTAAPAASLPVASTRERRARHQRTQDEQPAVPSQSYWFDPATLSELARTVRLLDAGVAVLLQGETGTGKEIFARQMHERSERAGGPFVAVNCAALPETLIESELFGYEDGAFTGARRQGSKGLLRQAQGGVLFLDEIGDMPLSLQARLLRVLQAREVTPLGGGRAVPVDFALICATHQPLDIGHVSSPVRSDLYFRIAEYTVRLPALREYADRGAIVRALWRMRCGAASDGPRLPAEVLRLLADYVWPGNFRQLSTTLRTLHVLAGDEDLRVDMLSADIRGALPSLVEEAAPGTLQGLTDLAIRGALQACDGNVSQAARRLGVHRSTLYRRVKGGGS